MLDNEFDFLHQINKMAAAEITEAQFKPFLPLFAYRPPESPAASNLPVADWWNLVKTPFGDVNVYEQCIDGVYKNLLFTVPPLLSKRSRLDSFDFSKINLSDVITQSKLKGEIFEGLGDAHLREHFLDKLPESVSVDLSIALRWNVIFERYGMPLIPIGVKLANPANSAPAPKRRHEEF
jgi:hypothetical protein